MRLGDKYWVRRSKYTGAFPQVFFDTKKECRESFKNFSDRENWEAVPVVVVAAKEKP